MSASADPTDTGLTASLRRLASSLLRTFVTRLEILSTEVAEERFNLTRLAVVALAVVFCLQVSIIFGVLFVVLAVGEANRVAATGIAALVLLLGALGGALWLRSWLKNRPPMFRTTIAELRKDGERIRGGP
jgi:uncharacterized membrane protein YqjE